MNSNFIPTGEVFSHLPRIYHSSNCLGELADMHGFLMEAEENYGYKKLRDALARERIARSGIGLGKRVKMQAEKLQRQKEEREKQIERAIQAAQHLQAQNRGMASTGSLCQVQGPQQSGTRKSSNPYPQSPTNGEEKTKNPAAANGTPAEIDLDEDFLRTLEKLAESGGKNGTADESAVVPSSADSVNQRAAVTDLGGTPGGGGGGGGGIENSREVAEWRQRFQDVLAKRYAKSERIRFLFCRKMYGHYVERVRQINRLKPALRSCKEKRMLRKFDLDAAERVLLDRSSRKPYLCYEDIFDAIYNSHMESDANEMRALFTQLKEKYANITFECVLEYFKVRSQQQQQRTTHQSNGLSASPSGGSSIRKMLSMAVKKSPSPRFQSSSHPYFLKNSSDSEDAAEPLLVDVCGDGDDGTTMTATEELKFSRSKYRSLFHTDSNNSISCKLCPFMLTGSSSNQTYQKIRNHVRYNHNESQ